jgi:hypothetical protein
MIFLDPLLLFCNGFVQYILTRVHGVAEVVQVTPMSTMPISDFWLIWGLSDVYETLKNRSFYHLSVNFDIFSISQLTHARTKHDVSIWIGFMYNWRNISWKCRMKDEGKKQNIHFVKSLKFLSLSITPQIDLIEL